MLSLLALTVATSADSRMTSRADVDFQRAIEQTESMVWSAEVQELVARHGLSAMNVTWEDTGRSKGSVWGPNISDMTIGVRDSKDQLHPMPVIRFDNFNDETADVRSDRFWLPVGNATGDRLHPVSLASVLKDTRAFLHDEGSWKGSTDSLWDARDKHVLVSAQACFLPVPRGADATFTPVLYNYQSYPGNPAVLTIVATREGTSIQVVENDGGYMSEVLFFNQDGERAPFTATRASDFHSQGGDGSRGSVVAAGGEDGLNTVLLIQVPLKQKNPQRYGGYYEDDMMMAAGAPMEEAASRSMKSDVEAAVIGHGEVEGPFTEIHDLQIERDPSFPVRVTVQFYKATSNGVVTDADVADIRRQIDRVYRDADYVGSLVSDGFTGRPTEWVKPYETAVWAPGTWERSWVY